MKKFTYLILFCFGINLNAQVGIGTTSPVDGSILELESTDKGIMIPRMDITNLTTLAPVTKLPASPEPIGLMVFNTDASNGGANQGFFYWDGNDWIPVSGNDWRTNGNSGTVGGTTTTDGVDFIGTNDDQNLNFRTNGILRGRFSNLGEFFVGTQSTIIPGDLMNAVGNASFPWAVNGYTTEDGAGVYGSVQSGATGFAAVQGEYLGTNTVGPGVRGITYTTSRGFDFDGDTVRGVHGTLSTGNLSHAFGIFGDIGGAPSFNFNIRTGGVLGTNLFARGALGYYASNGIDYSVYGFGGTRTNGVAAGRMSESSGLDTHIGLGIHGGFMGGWIKGSEYGALFSGNRFGSYIDGKSITNDTFIVLDEKPNGDKQATYASTSMSIDVQSKGIGQLNNGVARIEFNQGFSDILDQNKPIIVTVTPYGESNGVHLVNVDASGFTIKENNSGQSNTRFNWIAIAEKQTNSQEISKELLSKEFDSNINGLMHNDELDGAKAMWMENGVLQTGKSAPFNTAKIENGKKIKRTNRVSRKDSKEKM